MTRSATRTWHVAGRSVVALGARGKAQLACVAVVAGALVDARAHTVATRRVADWQC